MTSRRTTLLRSDLVLYLQAALRDAGVPLAHTKRQMCNAVFDNLLETAWPALLTRGLTLTGVVSGRACVSKKTRRRALRLFESDVKGDECHDTVEEVVERD